MNQLKKKQFISLDDDLYKDYIPHNINVNENLSKPQKLIIQDTVYLQFAMITAIGVITILPESVSKWDKDEANSGSLGDKWKKNVSDGPVMDEDDFVINYIGHPVSGAIYYSMARNDGLDPFESFLFSSFMSTFVWEYGYEAFAEIPSIQDLWSTPVIGSFMGEGMFLLEKRLDANRGLVFGSSYLGNISYWLLDPMGRIAEGLDSFLGFNVTMKIQTYQPYNYTNQENYNRAIEKNQQFSNTNYGVILNFEY